MRCEASAKGVWDPYKFTQLQGWTSLHGYCHFRKDNRFGLDITFHAAWPLPPETGMAITVSLPRWCLAVPVLYKMGTPLLDDRILHRIIRAHNGENSRASTWSPSEISPSLPYDTNHEVGRARARREGTTAHIITTASQPNKAM